MSASGGSSPARLRSGDTVCLVSPASTPPHAWVQHARLALEGMGLKVVLGKHVFDQYGFLAGTDEDRLSDLNDAFRDPVVKAVIATRGGKGAYRIADGIDFAAVRKMPKLFVGFSENTIIHLALWKHCRVAGLHGAAWNIEPEAQSGVSFRRALFTTGGTTIMSDSQEPTAALTTSGKAKGILLGGNQDMIATGAGWALPSLRGSILLLEAVEMHLGHIDRQLTMLEKAGLLRGIVGVAVGQYVKCGNASAPPGYWTIIDVLRDRLGRLNVPILGGLPVGHGMNPIAVPLGVPATLDADSGMLTVGPCVAE